MGCGGVFVDPDTLESLTRQSAMEAGVSVTGARRAALLEADVRYRPCPSCGALMMRRNFAGRSGVLVDVCRPHGVWFDANELTAVLMFVASGGLREVERAAAEEAKRELAERRAAALALQAKAACTGESLMIDSAAALLGAIVELFRARSR
jgi:Zn-finger nucleic acid-binding protein